MQATSQGTTSVFPVFQVGDANFDEYKICRASPGMLRVVKINHCKENKPQKYTVLGERKALDENKKLTLVEARSLLREHWSNHDMQDCCVITIFDEYTHGVWNSILERPQYL